MTRIAHRLVEADEPIEIPRLVVVIQVGLVEDQNDGHPIGLCRGQETVNESSRRLRMAHGDHQKRLVDIGRKDVTLLREVLRLTDDVVLAVVDLGDKRRALIIGDQLHTVAHGNRIGAPDAAQPEVALHLTFYDPPLVGFDGVPKPVFLTTTPSIYALGMSSVMHPSARKGQQVITATTDEATTLRLDGHDLLLLGSQCGVNLLDKLIVNLLQVVLGILLQVFRQSSLMAFFSFSL
jgi:hypothetical protein